MAVCRLWLCDKAFSCKLLEFNWGLLINVWFRCWLEAVPRMEWVTPLFWPYVWLLGSWTSRSKCDCRLAYLVEGFLSNCTFRLGSVVTLVWNSVRPLNKNQNYKCRKMNCWFKLCLPSLPVPKSWAHSEKALFYSGWLPWSSQSEECMMFHRALPQVLTSLLSGKPGIKIRVDCNYIVIIKGVA